MGAPEIWEYQDGESLYRAAASMVRTLALFRSGRRGRAVLGLSGDCPQRIFSLLAGEQYQAAIPWELVELVWTSAVFDDMGRKSQAAARELLLARVPVMSERVHEVDMSLDPGQASEEYGRRLSRALGDPFRDGGPDVTVLSMRPDGRLAESVSLEAETWAADGILEADGPAAGDVEPLPAVAVPPAILNRSFAVLLLAAGRGAGMGLATLLPGRTRGGKRPWLNPVNRFVVFVDSDARTAWKEGARQNGAMAAS